MAQGNVVLKDLLKHRMMLIAFGAVALIAVASAAYYVLETQKPAQVALPSANQFAGDVSAAGTIEPLENPDLFFASAGRITYVGAAIGDRVYAGQMLASLDTATLSAERAQAQANEKAQEAKLDELKAGPRPTDIAVKQSAVDQATQARDNAYADLPGALADALAKSSDAVFTSADPLFSNANTTNPLLMFSVSNSSFTDAANASRIVAGGEIRAWQAEIRALGASPSHDALDAALASGLAHLTAIRGFEDAVAGALSVAIPNLSFSASSLSTAQASVGAARANVNGLVTSLTGKRQAIISDGLAIASAQAQLNQLLAGASAQDIAAGEAAVESAQAAVHAVDAQIANNVITAPFSGTVGSVSIKRGDMASPNTPAITLVPDSGLEVSVFVSEIDATRIQKGNTATVTLDAYGSSRPFSAHVAQVATAPSMVNGVPAYEVKLSFDTPDSAIKTGMTANAIIHPASAQ